MKKIILVGILLISSHVYSQVGINTKNPKSTLDVDAKRNSSGTIADNAQTYGLQAPRLTRAELTALTATYGADQGGTLIYITDISGGDSASPRTNVDAVGYYYFDGELWQKIGGGDSTSHAWVNDTDNTMIMLGAHSDGYTARATGAEFVAKDNGAVGIGTASPIASAILDISATDKGIIAPRVPLKSPTDATTIANPATGLLVYNTGALSTFTYKGYVFWNGTEWRSLDNSTTENPSIITLQCGNANLSPAQLIADTPYSGYMYVPYTGGNGASYSAGSPIASTGNTGLTATLQAGKLAQGNGTLIYLVTGTPLQSSPNLATFDLGATVLGATGCTVSIGTLAASGSDIRKLIYSGTTPDPAQTMTIGEMVFRINQDAAGASKGHPEIALNQSVGKTIYIGMNQQFDPNGFQYKNWVKTFTAANATTFQRIATDDTSNIVNTELNVFHIVDVSSNAYYRVTMYISGPYKNTEKKAYVIIAEQF